MDFEKYLISPDDIPDWNTFSRTAISAELQAGKLELPPEAISNSRAWIQEESHRRKREARKRYHLAINEANQRFLIDLEQELFPKHWKPAIRHQIHDIVSKHLALNDREEYYEYFDKLVVLLKNFENWQK